MPQSEPTLHELCQQLDSESQSDRQEIAPRLHRYFLQDPSRWEEISDSVVGLLVPHLDAPDPTVRSAALFVLGHIGAYGGEYTEFNEQTYTQSEIVERMLEAFDDGSRTVRQTVANPFHLEEIAEGVLDDTIEVSSERIAHTLFDALRDPAPIVRKRVGKIFCRWGTDLIAAHSEPEDAAATLIDVLEDPVDGLKFYQGPVVSPRWVALYTLWRGIDYYDAEVLVTNVTTVTDLLEDGDRSVRRAAAALLVELDDQDIIDIDQFGDQGVTELFTQLDSPRYDIRETVTRDALQKQR